MAENTNVRESLPIDMVDLNELRCMLGDSIFKSFFDAIQSFLTVDDDSYTIAVKQTFVRHQIISLIESLKRK